MHPMRTRLMAAQAALSAYEWARGSTSLLAADETLCDLLTDLRHQAAHDQVDFELALRRSAGHFEAEQEED